MLIYTHISSTVNSLYVKHWQDARKGVTSIKAKSFLHVCQNRPTVHKVVQSSYLITMSIVFYRHVHVLHLTEKFSGSEMLRRSRVPVKNTYSLHRNIQLLHLTAQQHTQHFNFHFIGNYMYYHIP